MPKLNLKKGDSVKVLAGRDRGKTGKIIAVDTKQGKVTVDGVNIRARFQRPRKQGQKGQIVHSPYPLNPAKLILICPSCAKPTRVMHQVNEAGKKMRKCKKCGNTFN